MEYMEYKIHGIRYPYLFCLTLADATENEVYRIRVKDRRVECAMESKQVDEGIVVCYGIEKNATLNETKQRG